jgi:hypothetical protein
MVGLTIIPFPTVHHTLTDVIDKVNGNTPVGARVSKDRSLMRMAEKTRAANAITKQMTATTSAVAHATSQKDLAHAIAEQVRAIVDEAMKCCANARAALEEAHCARVTMIKPIKIAKANEMIEVAEVTVSKLECTTTAKGNIAYGANAFAERACNKYYIAVNALKNT